MRRSRSRLRSRIWRRDYDGYLVRLVDSRLMEDCAGLHRLTTLGRKLGIPENEIWLAEDLAEIAPLLALHEAVELKLRQTGWNYADSHAEALRAEREVFDGTPLGRRARILLAER